MLRVDFYPASRCIVGSREASIILYRQVATCPYYDFPRASCIVKSREASRLYQSSYFFGGCGGRCVLRASLRSPRLNLGMPRKLQFPHLKRQRLPVRNEMDNINPARQIIHINLRRKISTRHHLRRFFKNNSSFNIQQPQHSFFPL